MDTPSETPLAVDSEGPQASFAHQGGHSEATGAAGISGKTGAATTDLAGLCGVGLWTLAPTIPLRHPETAETLPT